VHRPPAPTDEPGVKVAVKTLLLADLVDSTRLFARLGDARASELSARHDRLVRERLRRSGGREIDKTDGFLLLFDRPIDAVAFALDYHRRLARLAAEEGVELRARVGIHLGEVYLRRNPEEDVRRGAKPLEVEGLAKPAAARLMGLAAGGQTLLTRAAFDLARRAVVGSPLEGLDLHWLAHGPYRFQGVSEPEEVFEVGEVDFAPLAVPPDSPKAHRVVVPGEEITLGWRAATGQRIPHRPGWVLREKLSAGGFGEVWLAVHEKSGEKRMFKFCYQADRLRALQHEVTLFRLLREALGHRDDIARILDWNFDEAPYFLESDYSAAGSLVDWAAGEGGLARIPLELRLELIAQVADALAAAHSVGVLHKDVKPANVLIGRDRDGGPKAVLTDFGIGLVTDRDLLAAKGITTVGLTAVSVTSTGTSTTGTHLYMAPELLEGKVPTVQADVYALGVMLFQIVVGDFTRALAPGWEREIDDELLREDVAALVDGSPERRPRSATEVAERLRGLEERRRRRLEERRARREAERARRLRRALATVAAVATVFLAVVTLLALQAHQARQEAERRRAQADDLIDFMLFDLRDGLEPIGRLDLLEKVARESRGYFASLPPESDSPASIHRRGVALLNVGDVLISQGDTGAALESYRAARELFDDAASRHPGDQGLEKGRIDSRNEVGDALREQGKYDSALAIYHEALELAETATASVPESRAFRDQVARGRYNVAFVLERVGRLDEALAAYREAREAAELLAAEAPVASRWQPWELVLDVRIRIARVLGKQNDHDAALAAYDEVLELAERLAAEDPSRVTWRSAAAESRFQVGLVQYDRGHFRAAVEAFRRTLPVFAELAEQDPTNVRWQNWLAATRIQLGRAQADRGEVAEAIATLEALKGVYERLIAQDPSNESWRNGLATAHHHLGELHLRRRRWPQARTHTEAACEIWRGMGAGAPERSRLRGALLLCRLRTGELRWRQGEPAAGLEALEAVRTDLEAQVAREPENTDLRSLLGQCQRLIGELHRSAGRSGEALAAFQAARELFERVWRDAPGDSHHRQRLARVHLLTGRVLAARGEERRGREEWRRTVELLEGAEHPFETDLWLDGYAGALLHLGRREEAAPVVAKLTARGWNDPELLALARRHGLVEKE